MTCCPVPQTRSLAQMGDPELPMTAAEFLQVSGANSFFHVHTSHPDGLGLVQ